MPAPVGRWTGLGTITATHQPWGRPGPVKLGHGVDLLQLGPSGGPQETMPSSLPCLGVRTEAQGGVHSFEFIHTADTGEGCVGHGRRELVAGLTQG